jgi:RNA polymerase sigma-70 factor (ECF subfamily)
MIFSHHGLTKKLVQGCLDHNRKYQKQLFDQYKDAMYSLAYRIIRNEQLAEDAVQEGFIRVFNSLGNYRFESTLGSWIKTIMVRSALRHIKNEMVQFDEEMMTDNITIEWDDNLTGEMLDKAISQLSPGYRTVFLLIETEGYSHKEVAGILGISEGTSKSQLARAKVILRQKLWDFRR